MHTAVLILRISWNAIFPYMNMPLGSISCRWWVNPPVTALSKIKKPPQIAIFINIHSWAIIAICETVVNTASNKFAGNFIRINKPSPSRVIIPAPQIVQPRLHIVHVAAIAEGIVIADGIGQRTGNGQQLTPGIVGVPDDLVFCAIDQADDIALQVIQVAVLRAVEFHNCRAVLRIIPEMQVVIILRHVDNIITMQRILRGYKAEIAIIISDEVLPYTIFCKMPSGL